MVKIKVYDDVNKEGEKCKTVDVHLEGSKLDIMAELSLALKDIIDQHFEPADRFAFLATLIKNT